MPSTTPLTVRTIAVAVAAGLVAAALTDVLLAVTGAAQIVGLQVGVAAAPLLALLALPGVRSRLVGQAGSALTVAGIAWTLAPFVDQHLTGAVVVAGAPADLIHHLAGWPLLLAGVRLVPRPGRTTTS